MRVIFNCLLWFQTSIPSFPLKKNQGNEGKENTNQYFKMSLRTLHKPGDSKCPFHPLVGGHLTPWKGHVFTIPKRSRLESPGTSYSHSTTGRAIVVVVLPPVATHLSHIENPTIWMGFSFGKMWIINFYIHTLTIPTTWDPKNQLQMGVTVITYNPYYTWPCTWGKC